MDLSSLFLSCLFVNAPNIFNCLNVGNSSHVIIPSLIIESNDASNSCVLSSFSSTNAPNTNTFSINSCLIKCFVTHPGSSGIIAFKKIGNLEKINNFRNLTKNS